MEKNQFKECKECGIKGDKSIFEKNRKKCKICHKKYQKKYRLSHKETARSYSKKYRKNNFDKLSISQKQYREKNKEIIKIKRKKYRNKNKKNISEMNKKWRQKNASEISKKRKEYYQTNKDKKREKDKIYREKNKDKLKKSKLKWLEINKDKLREKAKLNQRERMKNPFYRFRNLVTKSIARTLKKNGNCKNGQTWLKYISYTMEEAVKYIESLFEPWMNWENWGIYNKNKWNDLDRSTWKWNLDHIIPHSELPYDSMEHPNFKKAWALENLRPYSAKQNVIDGVNRVRHKQCKQINIEKENEEIND